jgi:hypothetical protein
MAESKNTFLKGKMNKDLDNRLLGEGEYRDALNISVGKSEDKNVGSLQNILGNELLIKPTSSGSVPFESNTDLVCIGYVVDNERNRIFQFLTDYVDTAPSLINPPGSGRQMKITVYDPTNNGNPYLTLVSGTFLNFSTTNLITGVNLVENLLFWTDNRNQPRKINVDTAISNSVESGNPYYTNAEQIAVAKYAPFKAPSLYSISPPVDVDLDATKSVTGPGGFTVVDVDNSDIAAYNITVGDQIISQPDGIGQSDNVVITKIFDNGSTSSVYITGVWTITNTVQFYKCTMGTAATVSNINGNDNFLEDKFVRFSYRFRFDDNEYSLIAPFTQPTFIPNQKGYFINGDEDAAYRSTVLEWMENSVNEVKLIIELPDTGANIATSYKIKSIDILYKESDSLAIKVVDTISVSKLQQVSANTNIYTYKYQSQKPKKTLAEAETLRVYDKIPVRALGQESVGNRIIYGNFINQNTPPATLNYNVSLVEKGNDYTPFTSWIEYPNHNIKQNRTYQVGVVLSDKFGRQSSVILSSAAPFIENGDTVYGGSSVFIPYKSQNWTTDVRSWFGDELVIIFNETINSVRNEGAGTPGLYATVSGVIPNSQDGFEITAGVVNNAGPYTYTYTLQTVGTPQLNRPRVGNYLKGKYKDYVKVLTASAGSLTADGPISDIYNFNPLSGPLTFPDIKFSYTINELGWYSYKIVVKQQEQDYYNVYVPGMLAGYPTQPSSTFPTGEDNTTCHFVSINDNINKVPRDLSEVGPNQRQYRSSVQLWPRVENMEGTLNRQYFPGAISNVVNTIAPSDDLNFLLTGSAGTNLYQLDTDPLINRVSTSSRVGVTAGGMVPYLGIFETDPVSSLIDLFWETSTTGYISDLNIDVLTGSDVIVSFSDLDFIYRENQDYQGTDPNEGTPTSPFITEWFYFKNAFGVEVFDIDSVVMSVADIVGNNVSSKFALIRDTNPLSPTYRKYKIKITQSDYYYGTNVDGAFPTLPGIGTFIFTFNITHTVGGTIYNPILSTQASGLKITNVTPVISNPPSDGIVYNLTNDPLPGPFIDGIGRNGNFSANSTNYLADLYWTLPSGGSTYFSIDNLQGNIIIGTSEIPYGEYFVTMKLQDSTFSTGVVFPVGGSLSTTRDIIIDSPFLYGCSDWESAANSFTAAEPYAYTVFATGFVNFWKYLREGETILDSTVALWKFQQLVTGNTFDDSNSYVEGQAVMPVLVDFFPPSGYNGRGYFNQAIFLGLNSGEMQPAYSLSFKGYIYTTLNGVDINRSIYVDFTIEGELTSTSAFEVISNSENCTVPLIGDPVAYIPEDCYEWTIQNTSPFPIRWNGLHGNGVTIIGGIIQPGQYAKSLGNGGTYPVARQFSLSAMGSPTYGGGVITYTGSAVTCPIL